METNADSIATNTVSTAPVQKKGNKTLVIILSIVGILILCGVGTVTAMYFLGKKAVDKAKQTIENEVGKIDLNTENPTLEFNTDNGTQSIGENVQISEGFPKDVPVHPKGLFSSSTKDEYGYYYSASVPDTLSNVASFYKTELKNNGWNLTSEISEGSYVFEKDGASVTTFMYEFNGKTVIGLSYSAK